MLADPRPIAGGDDTLTKAQIDKIVSAHGAGIRKALEDGGVASARAAGREPQRPAIYPRDGHAQHDQPKSIGEAFITSDAYRGWIERFPSGGPAGPGEYRSDPVEIRLSMRDASRPLKARSLFTTADTSWGALSDAQYVGLLAGGLVRPPKLRDLVAHIPVASDQVEYVKENARVAGAAAVAEASATTGTTGTKPEGGITFTKITESVRTIALWVPATTRVVADAPQLRAYIDEYLDADIQTELEDQIVSGDGTGENLTGLLNVAGTQTLAAPVAPASNLDAIRQAITLVRVNARSEPSAIVLNPTDAQNIDLLKRNDEANNFAGPGPYGVGAARLWNVPVVETDALAAGTALVGDFSKAVLFDRQSLAITLGTINDQFIRNMVTVLGEIRAGFGVIRPSAFVKATLA
jgi:HK97 family phage major capsid protein